MDPRAPRNQIGAKGDAAVAADFGEREARCMTVAVIEAHGRAQHRRVRAIDDFETAAAAQELRQLRDVGSVVARMRRAGAFPGALADDVARAWEEELRRSPLLERRQQP